MPTDAVPAESRRPRRVLGRGGAVASPSPPLPETGGLRIAVADASPQLPVIRLPDGSAASGRGLALVDALGQEAAGRMTLTFAGISATDEFLPFHRRMTVASRMASAPSSVCCLSPEST